eukprot:UN24778
MWNKMADAYGPEKFPDPSVAIFPACKVSDYNTRSLSSGSAVLINDTHYKRVKVLQKWWRQSGSDKPVNAMSVRRNSVDMGGTRLYDSWEEVLDANLGTNDKPDYFSLRGVITHIIIPENGRHPWYEAVPGGMHKVVKMSDGKYSCEKLGQR